MTYIGGEITSNMHAMMLWIAIIVMFLLALATFTILLIHRQIQRLANGYIRSVEDIDDAWRHFRKFTRAQDRQGKCYYIRYYDPASFLAYVPAMALEKRKTFFWKTDSFIVISEGQAHRMTLSG